MRSLVFLLFVALASAKVYQRCEWARVLKSNGMDGYYGHSLANCEYRPVSLQILYLEKDITHLQHFYSFIPAVKHNDPTSPFTKCHMYFLHTYTLQICMYCNVRNLNGFFPFCIFFLVCNLFYIHFSYSL